MGLPLASRHALPHPQPQLRSLLRPRPESKSETQLSLRPASSQAHDHMYLSTWGYCNLRALFLSQINHYTVVIVERSDSRRHHAATELARSVLAYRDSYNRVAIELRPNPPIKRRDPSSLRDSITHDDLHSRVGLALNAIQAKAERLTKVSGQDGGIQTEASGVSDNHCCSQFSNSVDDLVSGIEGWVRCLEELDKEYQLRAYGEDPCADPAPFFHQVLATRL